MVYVWYWYGDLVREIGTLFPHRALNQEYDKAVLLLIVIFATHYAIKFLLIIGDIPVLERFQCGLQGKVASFGITA